MNIGLTGGIATGKSTVSTMLVEKGALLIDADEISREVVSPDHPILERVVARFGQVILNKNGTLNRAKLGERVFNDAAERQALNDIVHPAVRKLMFERMKTLEELHSERLVVVDIPLLFESTLETHFDEVLVVYAPQQIQLTRLMEHRAMTKEQAEARLQAQLPIELKRERADIVIDNSGELSETRQQVEQFLWKKGISGG